jgi:hypothetical protein
MSRPSRPPAAALAAAPALLALLALLAAAPAGAAALGRLFSSPEERAALDAQRDGAPAAAGAAAPAIAAAPAPPPPAPAPIQLNGVLRRSGGATTVWLDQQPRPYAAAPAPDGRGVTLRLPSGRALLIKPGQRYNAASGRVEEADGR